MVSQQLIDYIKQQMALGKTQAEIEPALKQAGWKQEDIQSAFEIINKGGQIPVDATPTPHSQGQLPEFKHMLKESFSLVKEKYLLMLGSAALPVLGVVLYGLIASIIAFVIFKFNPLVGLIAFIVVGAIGILLYIYTLSWGMAGQFTALSNQAPTIKENLKLSRKLVWSLLLVMIILNLVILGGELLFIIPAIILSVRYNFAFIAMVTEGKKGRAALAQSKAYVYGRSWEVFGRLFLFGLIFGLPLAILEVILGIFKNTAGSIVVGLLIALYSLFYFLFSFAFLYVFYKALKDSAPAVDPQKYIRGITGWIIWGVLASLIFAAGIGYAAVLGLSQQAKIRDQQRISDIKTLQVDLELYYGDHQKYPDSLTPLLDGYASTLPQAPTPADGQCTASQNSYTYTPTGDLQNFTLSYCLGQSIEGHSAGLNNIGPDPGPLDQ